MIKRLSIVLLLLTFGWVLIPSATYACGKGDKKSKSECVKKEVTSKIEKKKSCEKEDPCKTEHSKKSQGCGANCNHSNCNCAHFTITIAMSEDQGFDNIVIYFSTVKQTIPDTANILSSGFHTIWQPPKIS